MKTGLNDWNLDDTGEREAMLTAYALGELDDAATAAVDARLAEDAGLRAELDAIRAVAGELEAAFAADLAGADGLDEQRRAAVHAGAVAGADAAAAATVEPKAGAVPVIAWNRWAMRIGGGLALAATIGFVAIVTLPGSDDTVSELAIELPPRLVPGQNAPMSESEDGRAVGEFSAGMPLAQPDGSTATADLGSGAVTRSERDLALAPAAGGRVAGGGGGGGGGGGIAGSAPAADADAFGRAANAPAESAGVYALETAPVAASAPPPPPAVRYAAPSTASRERARGRVAPGGGSGLVGGGGWGPDEIRRVAPRSYPSDRVDRESDAEAYEGLRDNDWSLAGDAPLSTFSIDVDTASYSNVRRFLETGSRPPKDAVRIEELINSFDYDYPVPAADAEHPFSVTVESGPAPWAEQHRLVRVGLKGYEMSMDERPAANLVFLLDCSGSMNQSNKLPLVKAGLKMLLRELGPSDRVALVVYAGNAGMVLDSTAVTDTGRAAIEMAIDQLGAGGSTNGQGGIQLAYRVAAANMVSGGVNRVILCTDGDFNVGVSGPDALQSLVEQQRETGVFLSVCGFGTGNLKDDAMERLSNHGNGTAAYIDSMREAEKVFVRNAVSSLVTIAKDVKLQVDFNPAQVQAYRLIGYANRMLRAEDFNNDRVDAGEIGAGHTVTALYEIIPVGVEIPGGIDESKYTRAAASEADEPAPALAPAGDVVFLPELLTVRVRYKQPDGNTSVRFDTPHTDLGASLDETTTDFRFAASVAGFGMLLRDSAYAGSMNWDMVTALGEPGLADDPHGDRREFLGLVRAATVSGP